nr:PREDICTED: uncharacterized protein LOC103314970 isoform X1 [Tribolium castaneum]|eukprot:XP_015836535.1 PREDICTED: uncharacterized protein LOC103314970 isoform X1 [Tribolium castaneum]
MLKMLPEQENFIYQHFVELVRDHDLVNVMKSLSTKDPLVNNLIASINTDDDYRHNNRMILFGLLKSESETIFYDFVESLKQCGYSEFENKIDKPIKETIQDGRLRPKINSKDYFESSDGIVDENFSNNVLKCYFTASLFDKT